MSSTGLSGIWEDINNHIKVDVKIRPNEAKGTNYPVAIQFIITNNSPEREDQPAILFEEVRLKFGVPPDWKIQKAENLDGGQTFLCEHNCDYETLAKLQWTVEGRISPISLLQFRRMPSNLIRNGQLPITAYFDFLDQLKIHQWLEGTLKLLTAPGPDTTLAQMEAKEDLLSRAIGDINKTSERLQDFLGFVEYQPRRDDIIQYRNLVQDYFNRTVKEIGELIQILKTHRPEVFGAARDRTIASLTVRANEINKVTKDLKLKLGMSKIEGDAESTNEAPSKRQPPPPITLREIDLHGKTVEEAIPVIGDFLEKSYEDNVRLVRIIHGKGIGILRSAVREYLEKHKLVKSVRSADKDHGGEGATEARIIDFSVS